MARHPEYDEAWGIEVEDKIETYLNGLHYGAADRDASEDLSATLTGAIFCGCESCDLRERYYLLTLLVLEGAEAGRVRLVEEAA